MTLIWPFKLLKMPYLKQHVIAPQNSNISVLGSKGVASEMGMVALPFHASYRPRDLAIGSEPCSGTKHAKASEAERVRRG